MLFNCELSNNSKCKTQAILYIKITKIYFDKKSCLGPFNSLFSLISPLNVTVKKNRMLRRNLKTRTFSPGTAKILHTSWKLVGIKMILYEKGRVFSVQTLFVEKEKPFLFDNV